MIGLKAADYISRFFFENPVLKLLTKPNDVNGRRKRISFSPESKGS